MAFVFNGRVGSNSSAEVQDFKSLVKNWRQRERRPAFVVWKPGVTAGPAWVVDGQIVASARKKTGMSYRTRLEKK